MFSNQPRAMCAYILEVMADYRRGARHQSFRNEAVSRFGMWRERLYRCNQSAPRLP